MRGLGHDCDTPYSNASRLRPHGRTVDGNALFVSVQVYLTDAAKFQRMNAVYTSYFKDPRPTRTTVVVAKLVGPGNVEITVTARK